jgi:hypothetical protein
MAHAIGWSPEERKEREGCDSDDASEDVESVGFERLEGGERPSDPISDHGHDRCRRNEDDREHQPYRQPRGFSTEIEELSTRPIDLHGEEEHEQDEDDQGWSCPRKQLHL